MAKARHLSLRWLRRRAAASLLWERAWPAAWPAVALLLGFLIVALTDLLPALPSWLHGLALAAFAAGLGWLAWRGCGKIAVPDAQAATRRIEQASGLQHRPLATIEDRFAGGDDLAQALWRIHVERAAAAAARLKAGAPRAGLLKQDPRAFRVALALGLLIAIIGAGDDAPARLKRALSPFAETGPASIVTLDMWVTPPAYTRLPPVFVSGLAKDQVVEIPTGSKLLAQVSGGRAKPELAVDKEHFEFAAVDEHNFRVEAPITEGSALVVRQGYSELGRCTIKVLPDDAPEIEIASQPQASAHQALKLEYQASDDYGVEKISATIRRLDRQPGDQPIELSVPLPANRRGGAGFGYFDLTPHPWAGQPVEIRLTATDAIGQSGETEWVTAVLPERQFANPVAQAIIAGRRALIRDPGAALPVAESLARLANDPDAFGGDSTIFLGLTVAAHTLADREHASALDQTEQLLWDLAVRAEEGETGARERDLRTAEKALQDALQNNASDAEIQKLMDELKNAMDQYLKAMLDKQRPDQAQSNKPADPNARTVDRQELEKMLEKARELMRTGQKEQAQAMLNQLQQMLENLQNQPTEQQEDAQADQKQQNMSELQDMMRKQRELTDKNYQQSRPGYRPPENGEQGGQGQQQGQGGGQQGQRRPGGQSQGGGQSQDGEQGQGNQPSDMAGEQEAIRKQLGELMRKMGEDGEIPGSLGKAERAMREASDALQHGAPGQALNPQGDALQQMREAARELGQQAQQAGNGQGAKSGPRGQARNKSQGQERDPFGRPLPGNAGLDQGNVKIPTDNQLQRSRAVYDELRRRSADPDRPQIERDYLERLLKRF
jgi:uncharacterized protein (TIGR02302 family)